MGKRVASVSFRQAIKSFCIGTMPPIDPEIVKIFDSSSFLMHFPYNFRENLLYVPTHATTEERALQQSS